MSLEGDILLLAEIDNAAELSGSLAELSPVTTTQPYDALGRLADHAFRAVLIAGRLDELDGLARAVRRLCPSSRIYAICRPLAELDIRPRVGQLLDGYLIHPPTRSDVAMLRRELDSPAPSAETPGRLSAQETADLLHAAQRVGHLCEHLSELVGRLVGAPVAWQSADEDNAPLALLRIEHEGARVLVGPVSPDQLPAPAAARLQELRALLPALLASAQRTEAYHRLAITDHLTGAYNRRYFYELTDQILARADGRNLRVSLLLFDIDHFKTYNDTYGHAVGDEILQDIARLMKQVTRSHDIVARIGGDEFAVLFWDSDPPRIPGSQPPDTAHVLAQRLGKAIESHTFASLGPDAQGVLTISGGLAGYPRDGRCCVDLLRAADRALLDAKRSGRNSIRLIGSESAEPQH